VAPAAPGHRLIRPFIVYAKGIALMKGKFRALTAGATALAAVGIGVLVASSAALATGGGGSQPPWESSVTPNGFITFYNAQGQVITGGSITDGGLGAYAAASTGAGSGYTKATLFIKTPVSGENPGLWSGEQISSSTSFPNSSAPGPLASTSNPVETNPGTDTSLQSYIESFPNTQTATGYVGLYDVRLDATGPGLQANGYWDTVISVNTSNNTWSVDWPDYTQNTTTALSASPPSPQTPPASLTTLTATVTPAADAVGTVSFWNGSTQIGTTQSVTGTGGNTASVTTTPPTGSTTYTAVFTPAISSSTPFDIGSSDSLTYIVSSQTTPPAWEPVLFGSSQENSTDSCLAAFQNATTVTWAWQENGSTISGATASTFQIPSSLLGDTLTCSVTASNSSGSVSGTSSGATVVAGGAVIRGVEPRVASRHVTPQVADTGAPTWEPVLFGTVKAGVTDSCEAAFQGATTVTYAWQSNGTAISGATSSTFQVPGSQVGDTLTCSVVATNSIGSVSGTSTGTKVVTGAALVPVTKPKVSGSHKPGSKEKVTAGTWSPAASKVTYQWYINKKKVHGATKATFTVPKSTKKGAKITCKVTASATGFAKGTFTTKSVKIT
jgi:hypothetical protein